MPARESPKLLIVEDDADVREVLTSFLAADGYAAEGVANGQEARQIYKIGTFYENADQTLAKNGFAPNRKAGQKGLTQHA